MSRMYKMPSYGDLYTLDEFIELCQEGSFIDYDGSGYYSVDGTEFDFDILAFPSEIVKGKVLPGYNFVAWFNK